ncbi:hypothetical protein IWX78_000729 [Mycetocola sp. CAN_C7]|uniref:hypothetical protein n=1 Tax=Mycetocola sp. CAN_C7 TaxID=2787724 RepID=UPI0018CACF8D
MPSRFRSRRVALVLAAALTLTACTASDPGPKPAPPVRTSDPDAALTVVGDAGDSAASVATSRELFDTSPLVVVAPAGDAVAQELAARTAITLGVPLVAAEDSSESTPSPTATPEATATPGDSLATELDRLGAATVLAIGAVSDPGLPDDDAGNDNADLTIERIDATADAVTEATGIDPGEPTADDPAGFAAGLAAFDPPRPSRSNTDDTAIPLPKPAKALADTLALAVDDPAALSSIATARAAAVPVHVVPAGSANPQSQASVIDALAASTTTKTIAIGAAFAAEPALEWKVRSARTGVQLPGGGQLLFAQHQFVALYGTPSTSALGVLGEQDAAGAVQRARDVAAPYAALTDKTVVPMFEIIATVAAGGPGPDGNFSNELSADGLRPWVDAAAAAGLYVVIDLQPGRTDFLTQAKLYQSLLELPNVGLALDPEWRLGPDQVPLTQIGSVSATEVNSVTTWLADLTNEKGLPQKMLVLHQFRPSMISDRASIDLSRPEVAVLIHADGQGGQGDKQATWANLHRDAPAGLFWGWKNFYDEDAPMLTPEQTMGGVSPAPDLVTYQ